MSEAYQQPSSPEKLHETPEELGLKAAEIIDTHSEENAPKPEQDINKLEHAAHHEAESSQARLNQLQADAEVAAPALTVSVDKTVQQQALFRLLNNVRQHLPATQRLLSKVVHQPTVDTLSEIGSKTAARPSGILGGGICAFIGSLVFVYYAKHIGFSYNYALFFVLFIGGFGIGLIIELLLRLLWRRHTTQ